MNVDEEQKSERRPWWQFFKRGKTRKPEFYKMIAIARLVIGDLVDII
jgi:hypothetical protein